MTKSSVSGIRLAQWISRLPSVTTSAAMIASACLTLATGDASAQRIIINEPAEWAEGRAAILVPGQSLRVAGWVEHPSGVLRVLVNGRQAFLQSDSAYPGLYNFETILPSDSITAEIAITVIPRTSQPYQRKFAAELPGAPQPQARREVVDRTDTAGTLGAQGPTVPENEMRTPSVNPWRPFRLRAVAYGLAAVAGLAISMTTKAQTTEQCEQTTGGVDCFDVTENKTPNEGLGLALLGAAATGFLIDALVTSGKAKDARGRDALIRVHGHLSILAPRLAATPAGSTVELVRLRF